MYLSPNGGDRPRKWTQRARFFINEQEITLRVLACDTEVGFAICFVMDEAAFDPEHPRALPFKIDRAGYKGHVATETLWGRIRIEHEDGEVVVGLDAGRRPHGDPPEEIEEAA